MDDSKISAKGERAAIAGYLPQFDEFSRLVYGSLVKGDLEWIRVADPEAQKLDDIQFASLAEVHAYQVKWTISGDRITFLDFSRLLPLIASSWKDLKNQNPGKKVYAHLLTNKVMSLHDVIKSEGKSVGSFNDFTSQVWNLLATGKNKNPIWSPVVMDLKAKLKLSENEFDEFASCFIFRAGYNPEAITVSDATHSKQSDDIMRLSRFIIEKVADEKREVQFSRRQILEGLGWNDRFKTTFNHDLIIDHQRYQPIQATIDALDTLLEKHPSGYIFIMGGPGSGKSTFLTQWSKELPYNVVRYYAFDFTNPSSLGNQRERGKSLTLYFDLVFQIKELTHFGGAIAPYHDINYLRQVFEEQLRYLGDTYKKTGTKTVIVIDGLDHITREYLLGSNSLLSDLPSPGALPEGVYMILGSQTYQLQSLSSDVLNEFDRRTRTVTMDGMSAIEIRRFLELQKLAPALLEKQVVQVIEKSQGHPLYLSYVVEKIREQENRDDLLGEFDLIEGDIENYYNKIWRPIASNVEMIKLLGYMCRIIGPIRPPFVMEWNLGETSLHQFRDSARFLFNQTDTDWTFFHNSFRQFLILRTAINSLTEVFDQGISFKAHADLANFYKSSKTERSWKRNFHLFEAQLYDDFLQEATPDEFTRQVLAFRPMHEISNDAKMGLEIANMRKNPTLLLRYLFALSEVQIRLFNLDPAAFVEEFLMIGDTETARSFLRDQNRLLCDRIKGLQAARLFAESGDLTEASILFNLSYPEEINNEGIVVQGTHIHREETATVGEWAATAPYFLTPEEILVKINNVSAPQLDKNSPRDVSDMRLNFLQETAESYSRLGHWEAFIKIIQNFNLNKKADVNAIFPVLRDAIEQCLDLNDTIHAEKFLNILLARLTVANMSPTGRILVANLIYEVRGDLDLAFTWLEGLQQPSNVGAELGMDRNLHAFVPLLRFNKLLHLAGKGVPINVAIPDVEAGSDDALVMHFERMVCLLAELIWKVTERPVTPQELVDKIMPLIRFYYKGQSKRNKHEYKFKQIRENYFEMVIAGVAKLGNSPLNAVGDFILTEFDKSPQHWPFALRRAVLHSLLREGFSKEKIKIRLADFEQRMRDGHDVSGRINEATEHAKICADLGEFSVARHWLTQAFKESIGVGYRKDYQVSTWIEWLREYVVANPANAPEQLHWFLSRIRHLKDSTEGRAYHQASKKLLQVTLEFNLGTGLSQLIWQLDSGLLDFDDSLDSLLEGYLQKVVSESEFVTGHRFFTEFYLVFSEGYSKKIVHLLLDKGLALAKNFFTGYLPEIIQSIDTKAIETSRSAYFSDIETFCQEQGVNAKHCYPEFSVPPSKNTEIKSGSDLVLEPYKSLTESDVLQLVTDYASFRDLFLQESTANSYFNWNRVIDKIAGDLTIEDIEDLVARQKLPGRRPSELFARLSEHALALGSRALAQRLASESLDATNDSGWLEHYDGGTRLKALRALRKIDRDLSATTAFELFAHDIADSQYPQSFLQDLDAILPLITVDHDPTTYWLEIFGYLQRLMPAETAEPELPELLPDERNIVTVLAEYLLYQSKSPVIRLRDTSLKTIALLIVDGQKEVEDIVAKLPKNDEYETERKLLLFNYLCELKWPKLTEWSQELLEMSRSDNFSVRGYATNILIELGIDFPLPEERPLPISYTLDLGAMRERVDFKNEDPYFPSVDVNNAFDMVRIFEDEIKLLAGETGFDKANLANRIFHFMKLHGNPEFWTVEFEKKVRGALEDINFKYSYRRYRVADARNGLMYVLAELEDAGYLDVDQLERFFRQYDPAVTFYPELRRPTPYPIIKENSYGGVRTDWIDRIEENSWISEQHSEFKGMAVIGEYAIVKSRDHYTPTEVYMSQISRKEIMDKVHFIFGTLYNTFSAEYHEILQTDSDIMVVRNNQMEHFGVKGEWLAINPRLAQHLDWIPCPGKLFAWQDRDGKLKVESFYWRNGYAEINGSENPESGEGWVVVATSSALEQIVSIEPKLFFQKRLQRQQSNNAGRQLVKSYTWE
jgi:hypothetical protein